MTSKQYKDLSIKEFTKAAEVYETDHAGVYNMCKKDYPDVLAELEKTRVPAELAERHNRLVNAAKKPDWDALKKIFEE